MTLYNEEGIFLESSEGEYIYTNGMLFVRNMHFKNAHNYRGDLNEGLDLKLTFTIYQNDKNVLVIKDFLGHNYTQLNNVLKNTR